MADLNKKLSESLPYGLKKTPLATPTTLKWENMINKLDLNDIIKKAGVNYPDTYLLSDDYFKEAMQARDYPYNNPFINESKRISGFAPAPSRFIPSFGGGTQLNGVLDKAIVLNKDSEAVERGIMPQVYRHEFAHTTMPAIEGERNYGYILPKYVQRFLKQYQKKDRGEELKAEAFSGVKMPKEVIRAIQKELGFS